MKVRQKNDIEGDEKLEINSYISFNGDCMDAIEFYCKVFEVEKPKEIATYADIPPSPEFTITEDMKKLVMHSCLEIHGNTLMLSDMPPSMPVEFGSNITLTVNSKDKEELNRIFEKLSEGGKILMPLGETYWTKLYGYVKDRFGIMWQVNHIGE